VPVRDGSVSPGPTEVHRIRHDLAPTVLTTTLGIRTPDLTLLHLWYPQRCPTPVRGSLQIGQYADTGFPVTTARS
jgi:hypothetical protein